MSIIFILYAEVADINGLLKINQLTMEDKIIIMKAFLLFLLFLISLATLCFLDENLEHDSSYEPSINSYVINHDNIIREQNELADEMYRVGYIHGVRDAMMHVTSECFITGKPKDPSGERIEFRFSDGNVGHITSNYSR